MGSYGNRKVGRAVFPTAGWSRTGIMRYVGVGSSLAPLAVGLAIGIAPGAASRGLLVGVSLGGGRSGCVAGSVIPPRARGLMGRRRGSRRGNRRHVRHAVSGRGALMRRGCGGGSGSRRARGGSQVGRGRGGVSARLAGRRASRR